ncbi:ganglioside-induced differentiation-associated protein 1-like isoform X2 [Gordionus sp. m RMFG-2023]
MSGDEKIVYFYWPQCYYCQRVTIALHEKNIPFQEHVVKLLKYENFEPEYVKKNPLCLVPVIEDHDTLINESDRIIDYLENKFSLTTKLYPEKSNKKEWEDIEKFKDLISNLPVSPIFYGCQLSSKYAKNIKMHPEFVDKYISTVRHKAEYLKRMAEINPDLKDIYEKKMKIAQNLEIDKMTSDLDTNIQKMIEGFNIIEQQLIEMESHNKSWLCTGFFSVADVYLVVLMHRMNVMGLEKIIWDNPDNPLRHVSEYYKKALEKSSVKQMIPKYE